jgi:hypothetical protein
MCHTQRQLPAGGQRNEFFDYGGVTEHGTDADCEKLHPPHSGVFDLGARWRPQDSESRARLQGIDQLHPQNASIDDATQTAGNT